MPNTHKHKCPNPTCFTIWEHSDDCWLIEGAHLCPTCRTPQRKKLLTLDLFSTLDIITPPTHTSTDCLTYNSVKG